MAQSENILLLNLTRMGDLVQTTPLSVGLSKAYPKASIVLAVVKEFLTAASLVEGVDEVVALDYNALKRIALTNGSSPLSMVSEAEELLSPLLSRKYKLAINLTHSPTSSILMYLLDAKDKRGLQMTPNGLRSIRHPWMLLFHNFAHNKQITPFNLVDIYAMGGDVPNHRERIPLTIRVPEEAEAWAEKFFRDSLQGDGPVVAIQAGASDAHKMWHPVSFIRACRILRDAAGARFLFIGGQQERELAEKIHALVDAPGSLVAAGKTDLPQLCALLRRADLMITNDTGPMHLAAAVGTRVISFALGPVFYSNTGPYGEGHIVFQPSVSCAPCSFAVRCVNPECKNMVTPEAVASVALRRLRNEPLFPGCLDDGPEFAGCEVFLSGWGEDGLMDYLPLLSRPRAFRFTLERAYRRIWGETLVRRQDPPGGDIPVPSRSDRIFGPLAALEKLASAGRGAAREILRRSGTPGKHLDMFRSRLSGIQAASGKIRELGMAIPEVNGLCQMFAYEEENMKAADLAGAAGENVAIFGNLLRRTRSLAYLLAEEDGKAQGGSG
ncbi:MAG: glycosyltransferase family 9 protein [Deltaproteobacteria bacterium]|nr:glycosyltransferase family 9 protein [Deltaproteobacteria bacterium]